MHDGPGISRRSFLGGTGAVGIAGLGLNARGGVRPGLDPAGRLRDRRARRLGREYVVRGATVLTMDPGLGDLPVGDVHVRDGAIVDVGVDLHPAGVPDLDARGMIALPGLVETHFHLWTSIGRNLSEAATERTYLSLISSLGPGYRPEDTYNATRLGLAEAVAGGVTTVHDWSHNLRGPEWTDAGLRRTSTRARAPGSPTADRRASPRTHRSTSPTSSARSASGSTAAGRRW